MTKALVRLNKQMVCEPPGITSYEILSQNIGSKNETTIQ